MRFVALSLAVVLLAAACGGGSDDEAAPARWAGPRLVAGKPQLAVSAFNDYAAASTEPWTRSPLLAAAEYLRVDRAEATRISLSSRAPGEGRGRTTVAANLEGLLDDSIEAIRYSLIFVPQQNGTWRLAAASWTQRCRPERGHRGFSAAACV